MVGKHHCGQTFSTYLGGWEGRSPVRRAPRKKNDDFWSIFGKNVLVLEDRILGNTEFQKHWELRDRETRLFGAVSSRGK